MTLIDVSDGSLDDAWWIDEGLNAPAMDYMESQLAGILKESNASLMSAEQIGMHILDIINNGREINKLSGEEAKKRAESLSTTTKQKIDEAAALSLF